MPAPDARLHSGDPLTVPVASAAAAFTAGDILQHGGIAAFVVGVEDIAIGEPYTIAIANCVVDVTAASAGTFSIGDSVEWDADGGDDSEGGAVGAAAGDYDVGWCVGKAKVAGELTVRVAWNAQKVQV